MIHVPFFILAKIRGIGKTERIKQIIAATTMLGPAGVSNLRTRSGQLKQPPHQLLTQLQPSVLAMSPIFGQRQQV